MFIPQADRILNLSNGHSPFIPTLPLDRPSSFSLDMSGVAGLLGGDDAISAMTAVHVYGNSRFLGWYNNPGSFQIAKRLRSFAESASFHTISSRSSSSTHIDPTTLFGLGRCKGPNFRATQSGTTIEETGYLAALLMKECAAWDSEGKVVAGRRTQPIGITIADLGRTPASELHSAPSSAFTLLFASVPIAVSIGTCLFCAACEDWYAASLILVGIIAGGVSCLVLGSADFTITHPEPATGSPAGDGILSSDKDIVLLRGTEGAANVITRGNFSLRFSSKAHYNLIRWCSILLFIQFMTQLLLIPQASLFGQIMFVASLSVSALYNAWHSSLDKEKMHRKLLFEKVLENPTLTKYTLGTRTAAVVFMLLVLRPQNPTKLLEEFLPNDTKVWRQWKAMISEWLHHSQDQSFLSDYRVGYLDGFSQAEQDLFGLLYEDARAAYNGYMGYLGASSF